MSNTNLLRELIHLLAVNLLTAIATQLDIDPDVASAITPRETGGDSGRSSRRRPSRRRSWFFLW